MCNKFTKWTIMKEHANLLTDKLLNSTKEEAGAIIFNNTNDMMSSSVIFNSEGKSDSVRINLGNNHMVSFHTHPAKAYIDNGCVYGHPSGDDISHFIRLSLKGALNHAVFTLEGMYIVQIHPRFVRYLLRLPYNEQETILDKLYKYFSAYHGKRTYSYVKRMGYTPRVFVKECNTMNLKKLRLPEKLFDERKFPKRLISCVWFFTDDIKSNEKNYDKLWNDIQNKTVSVTYTNRKKPIMFPFLVLNQSNRTLNNVLHTIQECAFSS